MSHKLHVQKQSPATDVESHRAFKPGHFDVQTKLDADSQPEQEAADIQTQLSKAKRFGHNLNQVPVNQQIQYQAINPEERVQRDVVEEEKKKDEEASNMQR